MSSRPHFPSVLGEPLALRAPDGATVWLSLHGGHVLSWVPAGGSEMLYLSPRTGGAPRQAIRGGVPVIFPQFSERGPLTRHGFARTAPWQLADQAEGRDHALALLRMRDSDATRALWPHGFELGLTVRVGGPSLSLGLSCRNTGHGSWTFSAALHTYFQVQAIGQARVLGLEGCTYTDATTGQTARQPAQALRADGGIDRIYQAVAGPLQLQQLSGDGAAGPPSLEIRQSGFEDVVVWNPAQEKCRALADMPEDGWCRMLCIEAARILRPVRLQPGETWVGEQSMRVNAR